MRAKWVIMVGAIACALVAGCSSNSPSPSASPPVSVAATSASSAAPTPSVTPSASASPTSSEDALFAEAEAVFRGYWKADLDVSVAGGANTLPATVAQYVMDDYAVSAESVYRDEKAAGYQVRNANQATIRWLRKAPNAQGSQVAVESCIDSSKVEHKDKDTDWKYGGILQAIFYMKRDSDGVLKIYRVSVVSQGACK